MPLEKNSGAPHSSVSTWATSWQRIAWYDWHIAASASELAAVPLNTKNTSAGHSNIWRIRSQARSVQGSSP